VISWGFYLHLFLYDTWIWDVSKYRMRPRSK
jgi:hypothetical protein